MLDKILQFAETATPTETVLEVFQKCLQILEARYLLRNLLKNLNSESVIQAGELVTKIPQLSNMPIKTNAVTGESVKLMPDRTNPSSVIAILDSISLHSYIRQEDKIKKVQGRASFVLFSKQVIEVTLWSNHISSLIGIPEQKVLEIMQDAIGGNKDLQKFVGMPFFLTLRPEFFNYRLKYSAVVCNCMNWNEVFHTGFSP